MERTEIILVLEHIQSHGLRQASQFVAGNYFVSKDDIALEPSFRLIPRVVRNCVGGAAIRGLVATRIEPFACRSSPGYRAIMLALADTLKLTGSEDKKILGVQRFNNQQGYEATYKLVECTITRLKAEPDGNARL